MKLSPVLQSLAAAFQIPLRTSKPIRPPPNQVLSARLSLQPSAHRVSPFSSTARTLARGRNQPKTDKRITIIRYHLTHALTPRPLRLSRLRSLRHWTIHRAYLLHSRNQHRAQELELERQYNAMRDACEELRVGVGDGGRLFRQAMTKKGIFARGIPVEYARGQVDWPSREGWDHEWTR
ncbi:MAG: hypothetical protein FRX48_00933 [Lasallia pustulata]|uniref:Ribosomal protein L28/L40, mitochondrial n=1 Tax=Lasallia pustulata TaxID=136370 RepID=A0A5M8Q4V8_9LECA|nr:MAG: hypothetical protein FRX48_00933 [Lasallia pustulata]